MLMDVFVIPIGRDRYELYCEMTEEPEAEPGPPPTGVIGKLRHRFSVMLHAAEERQRQGTPSIEAEGLLARAQDRIIAWVAERIAEQRLLWNLRKQTTVRAAHPSDMSFEQVMTLVRGMLRRDYERHRRWLVIDSLGLIASAVLMPVPGPNIIAYYFAFRVVGHWLSMRGASQGLNTIVWTGRACPPLSELRGANTLEPTVRDARVHDVAARLRLQHLSTFFERVAIPGA
jgi:hypothetical protein